MEGCRFVTFRMLKSNDSRILWLLKATVCKIVAEKVQQKESHCREAKGNHGKGNRKDAFLVGTKAAAKQ